MDILRVRQLRAEAATHNTPETAPITPLEQLRYEQVAFDAIRRERETVDAQDFIACAVLRLDAQYSWVSQVSVDVIRHLSRTIDAFQSNYYIQHQKQPSAQRIYRHVRMTVETDTPLPQDEQAVVLLEALMNGDTREGLIPDLPKFS